MREPQKGSRILMPALLRTPAAGAAKRRQHACEEQDDGRDVSLHRSTSFQVPVDRLTSRHGLPQGDNY
jgi:hypothetical protein